MNNYIKNIAQRIKISRIASGYLSAKDFTEQFKIPASTYNQHENGKRALSLDNIIMYSEIFHVETIWLITGIGNPCNQDEKYFELEKKILFEQRRLEELGEIDATPVPVISFCKKYSFVDMNIFRKILNLIIPILKNIPDSKTNEVIEFCFELYNKIISSDLNDGEQEQLIKIGFESFFKGLGIRINDEILKQIVG